MAKYRNQLPQLADGIFLTDGGLETSLIFHDHVDLPEFAAFDLLKNESGYQRLKAYYQPYIELALTSHAGFILESPTWRANADWGAKLGYSVDALKQMNLMAIAMMAELRDIYDTPQSPMVISGCIGPRGDGYISDGMMTVEDACDYHVSQVSAFADSEADMVSALTLNDSREAIGITQAAQEYGLPVAISFTVETNGVLPSGQPLSDAILEVDQQTNYGPAYYMINCAHPTHFANVLASGWAWVNRIRGIRANASTKSHAELDESLTLDEGDPQTFARQHLLLKRQLPNLTILGGCCGTDIRHVKAICDACLPVYWSYLAEQTLGHLIG